MSIAYTQGDHICALYADEQEQLAIVVDYIARGLRLGERCLYAAGSTAALSRFRTALESAGVDAGKMARRGALQEVTNAEIHLAGGRFDSERMLRTLNDAVEAALNAGFTGLRTCGDMSWLIDEPEGCEKVVEYEALLNQFFRGVRAQGMCLYDRALLPPSLLDHALATHPSCCVDGKHKTNPFYELPSIAANRIAQPGRVAWKIGELRGRA